MFLSYSEERIKLMTRHKGWVAGPITGRLSKELNAQASDTQPVPQDRPKILQDDQVFTSRNYHAAQLHNLVLARTELCRGRTPDKGKKRREELWQILLPDKAFARSFR